MGLDIELEFDDDTQDGGWLPAGEAELRERMGRAWRLRPRPGGLGGPLLVHLGVALAALAVGAASTAGFLDGRTAQRDRGVALLHLAPVAAFTVDPLSVPANPTVEQELATPWTNVFIQGVTLAVVNDGPDPVAVLGATIAAPEFGVTRLLPRAAAPTTPGGVSVLRGTARFVCGDFPTGGPGEPIDPSAAVATIADLTVRTVDGRVRRESMLVDRYSDVAEQAVCAQMPSPQVVTSTVYSPSPTSGAYTVTVSVADRAPFPLRMTLPSNAVDDWASGGLEVQIPPPVTIAAGGSASVRIQVDVSGCISALEVAQAGYGFDTLSFADARDAPYSSDARQSNAAVSLADPNVIKRYCGGFSLAGVGGGSGR